jgi:diguanylate cyclase (GGDEF)-like protein/PAS domain S-box-containing protein
VDKHVPLDGLSSCGRTDALPESGFHRLTSLMARLCEAPAAVLIVIEQGRPRCESAVGLTPDETECAMRICAHAISGKALLVIPDARNEPLFANHILVASHHGIRFLACMPVMSQRGAALGVLAIIDRKPRTLTATQLDALQVLAEQIVVQLELRSQFGEVESCTGQRALETLRESEEHFKTIVKASTDATWDWNLLTDTVQRNESIKDLFGYSHHDFDGGHELWASRIHSEDRGRVLQGIYAAVNAQAEVHWTDKYRFLRKDGSIAHVHDRGFIIRGSDDKAVRVVGAMVDVSDIMHAEVKRMEADSRIREQASLLDKAKDAIVVRGIDNRVRFWNKGAERLYGWTAEEAIGRFLPQLLSEDPAQFSEANARILECGEWSGEIAGRCKDGSTRVVEVQSTLVRDDSGQPQSILAIKTDITKRKAAEQEFQHLAFYDPLTALPNRRLLLDRLQHALDEAARSGREGALMFIDLDNFKALNDSLGHDVGDLLLQQVAQRLTSCLRGTDTVARLGGDEFVVMLESLHGTGCEAAEPVRIVGERILAALNQPFHLGIRTHYSTASIGIALFDGHRGNIGEMLKRADIAMYQAKEAGRNTLRFFDPVMQAEAASRALMEAELWEGLRNNEFVLHYQPQVEGDGRVTGLEALVRWQHPRRGMVPPAEFIPLAEETGLILTLGHWVLQAGCAQLYAWSRKAETAHLDLAVNVSARQFRDPDFVGQVLAVIDSSGANPRKLILELTESLLLDNVDDTILKMTVLKKKGIRFALDDFGTGYSSLSYLKRLPLDQLKIDRSFITDALVDSNDAAIARTIAALARSLGLQAVAEGVESEAQRDFLARNDCFTYQGYWFSGPLPLDQLEAFMRGTH